MSGTKVFKIISTFTVGLFHLAWFQGCNRHYMNTDLYYALSNDKAIMNNKRKIPVIDANEITIWNPGKQFRTIKKPKTCFATYPSDMKAFFWE